MSGTTPTNGTAVAKVDGQRDHDFGRTLANYLLDPSNHRRQRVFETAMDVGHTTDAISDLMMNLHEKSPVAWASVLDMLRTVVFGDEFKKVLAGSPFGGQVTMIVESELGGNMVCRPLGYSLSEHIACRLNRDESILPTERFMVTLPANAQLGIVPLGD